MAKRPKRYGGNSNRDHEEELERGSSGRHGGARRASEAQSWEREEALEVDSNDLVDLEELDSGETGR